ncbi:MULTISPECIES: hypothetical protein [Bacillus]|nr:MULTISPECIES: hypothetical protein [Bacillus]
MDMKKEFSQQQLDQIQHYLIEEITRISVEEEEERMKAETKESGQYE